MCATVCDACAKEWDMFKDDHCQKCSQECRTCAEEWLECKNLYKKVCSSLKLQAFSWSG